jgi:RimJ/RimL family protein N-acetyltransferase
MLHFVAMDTPTEKVLLRPADEADVTFLRQLFQEPELIGEFEWTGWGDPHDWQRRWEENGLVGQDFGVFLVVLEGERLGLVNYRRQTAGPTGHHWEIGAVLVPGARGHGYGTHAQRLLTRYLFAHTTVNRIEAWTETGNVAEMRSLEKAGFTREGVRRGSFWPDGAWRDSVLFGILRDDAGAQG